jgi:hypothetical protein
MMAKRAIQHNETGDQAYAKRQKLTAQSTEALNVSNVEDLQRLLNFQQNDESVKKQGKLQIEE